MKIKNTLKSLFALLFLFNAYGAKAQERSPSIAWTPIGPANISGSVRAVLADQKRPGRIYAGTASGGIFVSTDSARTWKVLVDNLTSNNISCMVQSSDGTIYVGTGVSDTSTIRGTALTLLGAGIFKSTDGVTFSQIISTAITDPEVEKDKWANVNDIDFNPNNPNHIFASTRRGLWVSKDGGNTWANPIVDDPLTTTNVEKSDLDFQHSYDVACGKNGAVLASIRGSLYLSKDFGESFTLVDTIATLSEKEYYAFLDRQILYKTLVAVSDKDDNYMYAAVIMYNSSSIGFSPNNGYLLNIYQSKDKGSTWKSIAFFTTNSAIDKPQANFDPLNGQGLSHGYLGVFPGETEKIYIGVGSYHTWSPTDGWLQRIMSYYGPFNNVSSAGDAFYWATDQGILKSFKGGYKPSAIVAGEEFGVLPYFKGISVPQTNYVGSDGHGKVGFLTPASGSYIMNEFSSNNAIETDDENPVGVFVPTKTIDSLVTKTGVYPNIRDTIVPVDVNLLLNANPYADLKRSTDEGGSWNNLVEGTNLDSVALRWTWNTSTGKTDVTRAEATTYSESNNVVLYSEKWDEARVNTNRARQAMVAMSLSRDYKDLLANSETKNPDDSASVLNFDKIYDYKDNQGKPALFVTRNPLELSKPAVWYRVASSLRKSTGSDFLPSNGALVAIATSSNQDIIYAAYVNGAPTLNTTIYRISNLNAAFNHKDSVWHYIDPLYSNSTYKNTCITKCNKIAVFSERTASSMAVDPNNQGNLIVTFGGYGYADYVYRATNADICPKVTSGIANFQSIQNTTLDEAPVYTSLVDLNQSTGLVVIGTENGAKMCDNAFTANPADIAWSNAGELPAIPVVKLYQNTTPTKFSGQTGVMYAATYGRGVYKSTSLVGIKKNELNNAIAKNQMLVYPNPSNGNETHLVFASESNTKVNVVVTDVNGRTLSVGQVQVTSGKNAISVNTQDLSSGTYFVTVRDGKSISFASKFSVIK